MDTNAELRAAIELLSMLFTEPRTGFLIGLLLAAAWSDYRTNRIPNALVFLGAILGLATNAMLPAAPNSALSAFISSLEGLACGLALMLPFYLLRVMGAGDVKLMAMCGSFLGFPATLWAVLATFLAGGALSLAYLAWKGGLRRALVNIFRLLQSALFGLAIGVKPTLAVEAESSAGTLPYGLAIAAGTIGYLILHQFGRVW